MTEIICKRCNLTFNMPNKRFKYCTECSKQNQRDMSNNYKKENKEKISDYNKNYNIINRDSIQKRQTSQHSERRKLDFSYKMSIVLRNRFKKFFKGKYSKSMRELVGCSYSNYIKWIEFNFTSDMNWENHGILWHIDHVLLCCMFDYTKDEDIEICYNWKNTRPLLAKKNLSRGKNIDLKDILNHEIKLKVFEKNNNGYKNLNIDFAYLTTKFLEKSKNGSS